MSVRKYGSLEDDLTGRLTTKPKSLRPRIDNRPRANDPRYLGPGIAINRHGGVRQGKFYEAARHEEELKNPLFNRSITIRGVCPNCARSVLMCPCRPVKQGPDILMVREEAA
jgi:hypothetical protein